MTYPFWIIRLSSHVLKVPLCMLNVSVTDRNRFFNSWVVSKRDINNKLIKDTFTVKNVFSQALLAEYLCVHPCCNFLNGLQIICVRQSTPFLSAHIIITWDGEHACLRSLTLLLPQQADSRFVGWLLLFLASFSLPLSLSFFTCCFSSFSWAFFMSFSLLLIVERSLWLEMPSSWKTTHISVEYYLN